MILFICTANVNRSRTFEIYLQNKYPNRNFRSAGISKYLCEKNGSIHIKQYMLDVADKIICMEDFHSDYILKNFDKKYSAEIEVLGLKDIYKFMDEDLINIINELI